MSAPALTPWASGIVRTRHTLRITLPFPQWWAQAGSPSVLIASAGGSYDDPCVCLLSLGPVAVSCGRAGAIAAGARNIQRSTDGRLTGILLYYQSADLGPSAGYNSSAASQLAATRATPAPPAGFGRTFWQVWHLARAGIPVRRAAWADPSKTVRCIPGLGTTPAVAVLPSGPGDTVATPSLITAADLLASDWSALLTGPPQPSDLTDLTLTADLRVWPDHDADTTSGNITWHYWRDSATSQPPSDAPPPSSGGNSDPLQPAGPIPPGQSGFLYRTSNGTTVLVPAADCAGNPWEPA